jgi:ornithine cyclodeaminase
VRSIPVIPASDLQGRLDEARIIEVVEAGLIDFAEGRIGAPLPGLFTSDDPPGDCHIKFAQSPTHGLTVTKIATGYYRNAELGLPVNDGLISVFSSRTGEAFCVVDDGGWVTGIRTAATGVIASRLGWQDPSKTVGVVGTGHQAFLQAGWSARHSTSRPIQLFGRSHAKARNLAERLMQDEIHATAHENIEAFAAASDIIICCTASPTPIIAARHLRPGHHIVSLGADGPGKAEIADDAYRLISSLSVDDLDQAKRRSDFQSAMHAGIVSEHSISLMGRLLASGRLMRERDSDITMVNMCGTAACDLALIAHFLKSMSIGRQVKTTAPLGS